jgi:hypothetical protein
VRWVRRAFVFDGSAVLVGPWHEPADPPERGARVEVRLLGDEPPRGTFSAAQRLVIDQPLFRADLFDRVDHPAGNLLSAHFHPHFDGVEPCDRHWPEEIQRDPVGWLASELADLRRLVERAGVETAGEAWLIEDAEAVRAAIPEIVRAVEAIWSEVRAEPA